MANFQKIKVVAKEKGIAINELAKQMGMTPQAIHLLVRENSTNTDTLERIAQILDVPVSIFFDDKIEDRDNIQVGGTGNRLGTHDVYHGINMEEHDELIRLREENRYLKELLEAKDVEIAEKTNWLNHFIGKS